LTCVFPGWSGCREFYVLVVTVSQTDPAGQLLAARNLLFTRAGAKPHSGGCVRHCRADTETGAVSICLHRSGPQAAKPKVELIADILASIKERRAAFP